VLEQRVSALEGGIGAIATASGQAALHLAIATLMGAGSHIVASTALYGGSQNLLHYTMRRFGIDTTFVKPGDLDGWRAAVRPKTKLLFGETVGNPGLDVLDIPAVSRHRARSRRAAAGRLHPDLALPDQALRAGRRPGLPLGHQVPVGHGTVIGGVVVDGGSFDWEKSGRFAELTEAYDGFHNMVFSEESTVGAFLLRARREGLRDFGACMSPHTAWLILQGIETLPLRMERHMTTRKRWWSSWPRTRSCRAWAIRCSSRIPAMRWRRSCCRAAPARCSASTSRAAREQGKKFIEALKLFSHLANVGDCRSLVIHPASTTHFRMSDEALAGAGITQGTIRLSIGLEDPDDLIDDLKRALKAAERRGLSMNSPSTATPPIATPAASLSMRPSPRSCSSTAC
jgi:O-acetylhomoserine (thiol)-lyase